MIGRTLGSYQVVSKLGEGGMGEVYRAHDSRLNRDVAIKILPAALAIDPERRARFGREARVLAALNHPNIATIHGIEERGGGQAVARELVVGAPRGAGAARAQSPELRDDSRQRGEWWRSGARHGAGRRRDAGRAHQAGLAAC